MPIVRQIIVIAVMAVAAGGAWFAYDAGYFTGETGARSSTAGGPPQGGRPGGGRPGGFGGFGGATLVVAAAVEIDATGLEVRAIGTAEAARAVTLYPEVTGVVDEVAFMSGANVEAGDELVHLAAADEEVAVDRARAVLDNARAALERAERLAATNNITEVALADAQSAFETAEIDLRAAEIDLAKRSVRAPFAGVIGMTDLTLGDLVSPSVAVATLDDTSRVTVAFDVPERATGLVAAGQEIAASAEALQGVALTGTITEIDSRVDPVARTLRVRATLPNTAERLKPGMAVTVVLSFAGEPRPQVPSLAIQWDRAGPYVWKVADGKAERTAVDIVGRRSGWVTVIGEVAEGDQVVVEGLQRLRDGADVRIAGQDAGPPAEGGGGQGGPPAGVGQRPQAGAGQRGG